MQQKRTWNTQPLNLALLNFKTTSKMVENKKKVFYLDPNSRYPRLKATRPYLDKKAFNLTVNNYDEYIDDYNKKVVSENKLIAIYNDLVEYDLQNIKLSENQIKIKESFLENYKKTNRKNTQKYNASVEALNNKLGFLFINKKLIQKVKDPSKNIFIASLYLYNNQLKTSNLISKKTNSKAHRSIIKLDFNSGIIKALRNKRGGRITNISTQSIRNHRMRLEECGIFVERTFHGYERGVRVHINHKILVVFDEYHKKHTCFDNQQVKQKGSEKLIVNNIITINKYNTLNKENIRSSHTLTSLKSFFTRTQNCKGLKNSPAAENFDLDIPKNSTDFKKYLIPTNVLATKLAKGDYFTPPEIEFKELAREATRGTLTRDDFEVILVNYFFMKASKLFKNRNASFGSWRIAIEVWQNHRFKTKAGKIMHKDMMLASLNAYLHGLNEVYKFCDKYPEYRTLYPNQYFDLARTDEKSGGFEFYAKAKWTSYLKQQERIEKSNNKSKNLKENRLKQANYNRRLEKQVRKWLNGKISYEALLSYSAYNLPKAMQLNLPELILNISERFKLENAA